MRWLLVICLIAGLKSIVLGDKGSELEGGTGSVVVGQDWSKVSGGHGSLIRSGAGSKLYGKQSCILVSEFDSYLESDIGSVMIGTYDCEYNITPDSVIVYKDETGKMQCLTTDRFAAYWLEGIQTIIDLVN